MKNLTALLIICCFFSCDGTKKSKQDAMTDTLESATDSKAGQELDLTDGKTYTENNGSVLFTADDKVYIKKDEKFQAVAIFQKENNELAISFQLAGGEGRSLITIVNYIPENFTLPLTGKFTVSNSYDGVNPVATMALMDVTENGAANVPMAFEGTLTITKLNAKEMQFEIDAKGGNSGQADSPSTWKTINVKGMLTSPIIQSYGINKKDVLK